MEQNLPGASSSWVVAAFYKFVSLPDHEELRLPLLEFCREQRVMGTILLAPEGINATVSAERRAMDALLARLRSDPRLADLEHKESLAEEAPFHRMKVKLKREIVTMGVPWTSPDIQVGRYVPPEEWNRLISDPDVVVVDTRNEYEVGIGTFRGAINPHTSSFREFPDFVRANLDPARDRRVAMFCTGGIRCEKATAYLVEQGFREVYHLQGGILKYLEEVPRDESLWEGECFVFDQRVTVDHDLAPGTHRACHGCWLPVGPEELLSPHYIEGVCCPRCHDALSPERRAALEERQRQVELARRRNVRHIGGQGADIRSSDGFV